MAQGILDAVCCVVREALSYSEWVSVITMEKDYSNLCVVMKITNWMDLNNGENFDSACPELLEQDRRDFLHPEPNLKDVTMIKAEIEEPSKTHKKNCIP